MGPFFTLCSSSDCSHFTDERTQNAETVEIWRHQSPWLYPSPDPFMRPKGRHRTLMSELTPKNVTPSPSWCSPGACTPGLGFDEFIFSESRVGLVHREQNPSSRGNPDTPLCYRVGGRREKKYRRGESRAALALSDATLSCLVTQ